MLDMNKQKNRGTFIVLYGNNNVGKTTQAKLLVEWLKEQGKEVRYIKYPIYDLQPTGPMLNAYLREGNPHNLSAREAQLLYAMNRSQYEDEVRELLAHGITVVAEDYTGTGIAWGISGGVDKEFLLEINQHLLKEEVALFLEGERFLVGKEEKHVHEQDDKRVEEMHRVFDELASEFSWIRVSAVGSIEEVHDRVVAALQNLDILT